MLYVFRYLLVSIINFIGQSHTNFKINELGHYTAHVRRTTGNWNVHDDLLLKVKTYKNAENTIIQPHILFYIKQ